MESKFWIFELAEDELLLRLKDELENFFPSCFFSQKFVYARGQAPICLIAHCDGQGVKEIYYDRHKNVIWSPLGINGDDRAGVLAIQQILEAGKRPHVLFTAGEERGGVGAMAAAEALEVVGVRALIELDRRGSNDAVFYDCGNRKFKQWVLSFGWEEAKGSFSDVSILGPAWDVAAVNLSVGFYQSHGRAEFVKLDVVDNTIERVKQMIEKPPRRRLKYEAEYCRLWGYKAKRGKKKKRKRFLFFEEEESFDDWDWKLPEDQLALEIYGADCELCEAYPASIMSDGLALCWRCWEELEDWGYIKCPNCGHRFEDPWGGV